MAFWNRNQPESGVIPVDHTAVPNHIGFIMDGNGRWAQKRGMPRTAGHAAGVNALRTIAYYCKDLGVSYITMYTFSTENWKRPPEEVSALMGLLKKHLPEIMEKMGRDGFRACFPGDLSMLDEELQAMCREIEEKGRRGEAKTQINFCLNYGGRDEIIRAVRAFTDDCRAGRRSETDLTEELFASYLDTAGIPDPDLIIRPGGELRLSNFLTWQSAYSEFYFTDTLWPDFTPEKLDIALAEFRNRNRRYGGV